MCWKYRARDWKLTTVSFLFQFLLFTWVFYTLFSFGTTSEDMLVTLLSTLLLAFLLASCCTLASVEFVAPKKLDDEVPTEYHEY